MIDLFGEHTRLLILAVAALFVLWLARGVIGPFVVAAVLAYAFSPVVSAVQERTGAPRPLVIAAGYVIVLAVLAVAIVVAARQAGDEIRYLSSGGPDVIASALRKLFGDQVVVLGMTFQTDEVATQIRQSLLGAFRTPSDALHMAEQTVDVALQAILCLIVTFYFLMDGHRFGQFVLQFLDGSQREDARRIGRHIHQVLGRWLRGQLLLIALVAVVLYLILGPVLHVPYALALGILSGVLEIIPLVGPIIAAALAGTVAFATRGTDTTIVVLVVYLVVRQVEDQVVMPLVIGRAVHLHPVVTIFAVLLGLSVGGVLGGMLGVPVAAAINVILHEFYIEEHEVTPPAPGRGWRARLGGGREPVTATKATGAEERGREAGGLEPGTDEEGS